ncbi:hypothetical protein [Chryseobacterium vrystaatense]|uniref:Lipoprotein n=1 Tax=Chryseobacterium vrystaatense TaxID=307480 RepID=A0A1M5EMD2_9FLAO|nr:hypothetical protein [Chryseobacterium vrystaatense]SHF80336.1 hypothetical protein SAMN02787073_2963 [Chryseobacterium vrystaatense]
MKKNTVSERFFSSVSRGLVIIPLLVISCTPDAVKKTAQKTEPLCWKDIRIGELPPVGAYDGIDSLVKKGHLCYERIEAGCEVNDSMAKLERAYEHSNTVYFNSLEKKLGKNWKQQFEGELHLLDSINWIRINREIDSLNR